MSSPHSPKAFAVSNRGVALMRRTEGPGNGCTTKKLLTEAICRLRRLSRPVFFRMVPRMVM